MYSEKLTPNRAFSLIMGIDALLSFFIFCGFGFIQTQDNLLYLYLPIFMSLGAMSFITIFFNEAEAINIKKITRRLFTFVALGVYSGLWYFFMRVINYLPMKNSNTLKLLYSILFFTVGSYIVIILVKLFHIEKNYSSIFGIFLLSLEIFCLINTANNLDKIIIIDRDVLSRNMMVNGSPYGSVSHSIEKDNISYSVHYGLLMRKKKLI
ncbi:hypothetical protein G6R29_00765 [Fructobacillus sp. M2-14]|uniref:Uncharacterized protein n=1 Tax=Fructobacillus broussonetiae TaxID=2713173 RepID=A0ABS5QYA3_9LACO|nr:hypothetical protein [Fructobacillus broussonetiae]MBS9338169.1 hypothetical protein [Fructobacillus broussonetiae]